LGRLLENLVFIELKRRGKELFYFKNKNECDFLIKEKSRISEVIQVTREVVTGHNEKREIGGVIDAMKMFGLKKGTILTQNQEEAIEKDGYVIKLIPIWKWLLPADAEMEDVRAGSDKDNRV
jgi:predicted AAA+ superfamily ATPase